MIFLVAKEGIMGVKKSAKVATKKTAKKTGIGTKTAPKLGRFTLDDLAESHAKTVALIAASHAETDAKIAKSREETDKALQALSANVDKLASNDRLSTKIDLLLEAVGRREKYLGPFLELNIVHRMLFEINEVGKYSFKEAVLFQIVSIPIDERSSKAIALVDMLLRNDTEVMAIEIKPNLLITDVDDHLKHLQKMHDYKEETEMKNKTIYGAIAGAVVNSFAKAHALQNGLYVVEINVDDYEEDGKLNVTKPETCKTW